MRGISIAGIVVASLGILGSMYYTGEDLLWGLGESIFWLVLSIMAYNNSK